jgi:hypothetical protein
MIVLAIGIILAISILTVILIWKKGWNSKKDRIILLLNKIFLILLMTTPIIVFLLIVISETMIKPFIIDRSFGIYIIIILGGISFIMLFLNSIFLITKCYKCYRS